jgi:sugar (pentulose or hexulose) kinase
MSYFLGIDLGTSYFKAGIFDEAGQLHGLGRKYVEKVSDGITCELPVNIFWETLRGCVSEAKSQAGISAGDIIAASYSSQANSFILLDSNDNPLTSLILWPDKRAGGMDFPIPDDFMEKTGLGITPNHEFAIAKINWFRKMRPEIWSRVAGIMSVSDYLVYFLTGQKVCDYGTLSMTGLFDPAKEDYWCRQLELLGIGKSQLPVPKRSGTAIGVLNSSGADLLGLSPKMLFCLGGLDHHMAAVGAGIPADGKICESTGTVLACVDYVTGYFPEKNICITPGLAENQYFRMIFDGNGAAILDWYRKTHASGYTVPQLLELAEAVPPGCEGLSALPCADRYPGLVGFAGSPRKSYHHGHYVRAVLESVSRSLNGLVQCLRPERDSLSGIVPVGGGGRISLLIRIKAECLRTDFHIPECTESACMGAALIGAAGTGRYGKIDGLIRTWTKYRLIIDN